ncbi:carbohydrate ABC transporter membrane protein 2 (CUT1 family) [Cohnella sp. SGD-V74]|jgi:multiple sugar transport system permease protein|uniref:carbohydrate ABC transporter permease n=1 Tax=unclassified Cohnella TaxID=2636738 RepID=UPI000D4F3E5D|nr:MULTISPECIES: carbohydrate ABC transporter permease [unclassified Cohnella]PRX60217.1 carbohydrate ABC transporter membrane protein 2 (CUT1 family) [Cohnella sp. SGD-V74]
MSSSRKFPLSTIPIYVLLVIGAGVMILPFLWMISTSLKGQGSMFDYPPRLIPRPVQWDNYYRAWTTLPVGLAYLNSLKIALLVTAGSLLTSSMAGYAFAKMKFLAKQPLFVVLLMTMMIPGQVTLIPMFMWFSQINWVDTHWPLILPPILSNAFGVFLLRQFMAAIPNELEDAGKIDGLNPWQSYWKIMLPNCKPALAALGIFTFMGNWNNFLTPLIYLNDQNKFTLPLIISSFKGLYTTDWPLLMAASCISLVPVLIVYLFAQRYFIEGITLSGLKG